MKVILISAYDLSGGAARAAYRLHRGLQTIGVDSQMLVQNKTSDDRTVIGSQTKLEKGWRKIKPTLDTLPLQFYPQRDRVPYSLSWLPSKINSKIQSIVPDIINLHWINGGFLPIEAIAKFKKPVVWTLHDMWAFTGGCHYSGKCDRYTESCGTCPQLHSNKNWDLSKWIWQRKAKAWQDINLTIVTPSQWLAKCARASSLFQDLPIKVIPNGINTQKYKPVEKQLAKKLMGLSPDQQIILFGAVSATSDVRKGFHLLLPALQHLKHSQKREETELVIFGASQPHNPPDFGFKVHYLGKFYDDISLALLYSAADVFVAPSIQDNLPNTILEALACGTPCVAFNIGGMPDLIDHKLNGYLAQPFAVEDLAEGIKWILADRLRRYKMTQAAREKVEQCFTMEIQAHRYLDTFKELSK